MNISDGKYQEDLTKQDFIELGQKEYLSDKELSVQNVVDGIILPPRYFKSKILNKLGMQDTLHGEGGVIDAHGQYVELSAQVAEGMRNRVYGAYHFDKKKLVKRPEKVIYINYFIKQWGHYLLDVIGRLWYPLLHAKDTKLVYTCYTGKIEEITGNYLEFLELIGISKDRLILINKPTQFEEVVVPESSILPGAYYTKEYRYIFESVIKGVEFTPKKSDNKKIYCSRAKLAVAKGKEFGEDRIEDIFINNGFKPVFMEKMSLTEQIRVLNTSSTIVMTSGSLAHNLLFMKDKKDVIILNKTYRVNLHQFLINEMTEARVRFVDIYISPLPILYGYGPFLVDITHPFKEFLKDNGITTPLNRVLTKKDYFKYYLRWISSYKFYLFRINRIKEGDSKFEKDFSTIRKYYKTGKKG